MSKTVLGISGYIGSGKTEAGIFFKEVGAFFIDADRIVDRIYQVDGEGYKKIKNFFGDEFIKKDGKINRKKLRKFVFSDVNKLKILNGLIHPPVVREIQREILSCKDHVVVVEAVYIDGDMMNGILDKKLWIECDEDKIFARAAGKAKYDRNALAEIFKIQKEIKIKPDKPDYIVDNGGSMADLKKQLKKIWEELNNIEKIG